MPKSSRDWPAESECLPLIIQQSCSEQLLAKMTLRSIVTALFLTASCLSFPTATLSQFQIVDFDYSCGPGFIPVKESPTAEPDCYSDPCYGTPGVCGAGKRDIDLDIQSL